MIDIIPNSVIKDKFVLELLNYSGRVRLTKSFVFEEDIFYVPTKEVIFMPCTFPTIEHEICHMIEMKDYDRCLKVDWGLALPQKSVYSEKPNRIISAAVREIRVRAINSIFSKCTKISSNIVWADAVKEMLPYGKFKTIQDFFDWEEDLHNKTVQAWNKDRIEAEWKNKLDYIHNWMETK